MAQVRGANIEALREINKIKLYRYDNATPASTREIYDKGKKNLLFSAYSKEALGTFTADCQTMSLTDEWIGNILKGSGEGGFMHLITNSIVARVAQQAFGVSTSALQYDYNYMFKGTSTFSKSFNCYLQTVNDVYEDVINPLYKLIKFVLPDETKELSQTAFVQAADKEMSDFTKHGESEGVIDSIVNVGKDIAGWLWNQGKFYFGGVSALLAPPQLDQKCALKLVVGDYIVLDNIIIEKVDFKLPFLTYEGGLFDHVDITFSIKGTRNMTIKTYKWLKDMTTSLEFSEKIDILETMNERYAPNYDLIRPKN